MCVWLPAAHLEPGSVVASGGPLSGMLHVGRYPSGVDDILTHVGADLSGAQFLAPVVPDVMRWKYAKLLDNAGNALEAVTGRIESDERISLARRAFAEGAAVLEAAGIEYASRAEHTERRGDLVRHLPVDGERRGGGSSWQSLERRTGSIEADYLNGEFVLLGRLHGVSTPVNEVLHGPGHFADGTRHYDLILDTAGRRSLSRLRRALTPRERSWSSGAKGEDGGSEASIATPVRGRDVAGRVEAIGKDLTRFQPGDEVFGVCEG